MIMHDHNIPSCDTLTPNACRSSPLHARLSTERDRVSIELVKWQDWMMVAVQPSSTADCTNLSLGLRLNSPVGRTAGTSPFAPGRHERGRSRPPSPGGATQPARPRRPETRGGNRTVLLGETSGCHRAPRSLPAPSKKCVVNESRYKGELKDSVATLLYPAAAACHVMLLGAY